MDMDEEAARSDVDKLRDLLDHTTNKSKKQKDKAEEHRITFENLEQYPYIMQQSAWELDWDKVQALYNFHIGVPAFIIDDSIIAQWSPTASPSSPQWWTDSEDLDTLYTHAVLLSLTLLNLLDAAIGREHGDYGSDPKLFVYSAVVIFVHPGQVLTTVQNAAGFFQQQYDAILQGSHSNGWCTLCKLPCYETSRYFPVVPRMPCLALPTSEPSADPTVWPQLCLDTAGCDANHMIIWLLHHMWHCDTDYTMMPPALQFNLDVPWDLHMEKYPKLWQNSIYTTWKAGSPGEEVGLAMTFVSTSHREFDSCQLMLDISDGAAIRYLASKIDDDDNGDESTGDAVEDDTNEDDSDDANLDEDLHKTVAEIAKKMDDSGFHCGTEDNSKIRPLSPPGTTQMGKVPLYSLRAPVVSTQSSMHMASRSKEVTGASFDAFINACADRSGVGELMEGQALLWDYTTAVELKQLCELANEQVKIARHFNTKFSDMVFTLLQKIHKAFIGTGGIAQKFVDDMATAALNFIRDTTTYEAELSASDSMVFMAGLTHIQERIAALIRETSAFEVTYEGGTEEVCRHPWVGRQGGERIPGHSVYGGLHDLHGWELQESPQILRCLQCLTFHPSGSGQGNNSPLTADFTTGECVTLPSEDIPLASYIQCHGGIGADGTAQLCGSTECCCTGDTGTVKVNTEDQSRANGPNSRVRPWIECEFDPTEAEAGQGGANAVKERLVGGPVIQDSYAARASTGPSSRRHSTSTASAIPSKEAQHS